jgi:ubiquinol-cytochrome c reductase cytochrome c1 subunit
MYSDMVVSGVLMLSPPTVAWPGHWHRLIHPRLFPTKWSLGGALPPDLSLMVKARHEGHDYIMSLLTGYMEPPAGKVMMEGLYYNPYFPGGGIAMPPPLQDEGVEYEDGTVATVAQQARDIAQFLNWTAEPEMEQRKKNAGLNMAVLMFLVIGSGYMKRLKWSPHKTRKIAYVKGM